MRVPHACLAAALLTQACAAAAPLEVADAERQVMAAERAFAATMADRDPAAFASFLAEDAIFFSGDTPIRGAEAVATEWRPFFDQAEAPFSWDPDQVVVLESGSLALSTGPVRSPAGEVIGRFNSVWRRDAAGGWRIVLDRGSPVCPEP
jgi:ketosteroid isomerase-like protein